MKISFIKMHGLGNDFIVIDNRAGKYNLTAQDIIFLCDRHRGIGCDQLLLLEKSIRCDVLMKVFNSDGSSAGGCGNGARCVAKYLFDTDGKTSLTLQTTTTLWKTERLGSDIYQVNMGTPKTDWQDIPLSQPSDTLNLSVEGQTATCINVGNPHAVIFVDDVGNTDVATIGHHVEHNPIFPQKTNVEFAQILNPHKIRMRVWERGEGITQACGTGAASTFVAASLKGCIKDHADIILDGGTLNAKFIGSEVVISGPAAEVFRAEININD